MKLKVIHANIGHGLKHRFSHCHSDPYSSHVCGHHCLSQHQTHITFLPSSVLQSQQGFQFVRDVVSENFMPTITCTYQSLTVQVYNHKFHNIPTSCVKCSTNDLFIMIYNISTLCHVLGIYCVNSGLRKKKKKLMQLSDHCKYLKLARTTLFQSHVFANVLFFKVINRACPFSKFQ